MRLLFLCLIIPALFACQEPSDSATSDRKLSDPVASHRVFYVNSHHQGYPWSDSIERAIRYKLHVDTHQPTLAGRIELETYRLDSKRNAKPAQIEASAAEALERIRLFKPEIIIVSDDNALKYLIAPHLPEMKVPVIFCGINWNSRRYALPPGQVTGMVEVQPVDRLLRDLLPLAKGSRVAFLKGDDLTARIEAEAIRREFGVDLDSRLVSRFADWKREYLKLQDEADLLIVGNPVSIPDWERSAALKLINEKTRIPTGSWDPWMAPYALLTHASLPEEQGEWAAQMALQVLNGTPVSNILQVRNKRSRIYLNMPLAKNLDIRFPMPLIENATLLRE